MRTSETPHEDRRTTARGRASRLRLVAGAVAAMALLAPATSSAQSDVAPPLPNVLILLDTSGSMERTPDSKLPAINPGNLAPKDSTGSVAESLKSRWIRALEVLGGRIQNLDIYAAQRTGVPSSDFYKEYSLPGAAPYDADYYLPHFRPLSNGCTMGPKFDKTWPTDWKTWGPDAFGFRKLSGSSLGPIGTDCNHTQIQTDGLGVLDTFRDQARFALMTFDTFTDPKTGWDGSSHLPADGMNGQWSYYPGWNKSAGKVPASGWPAGCVVDPGNPAATYFELGARNPSAPPWEGPLIPFAADDSTTALHNVNDRIRYALFAARPYGATPLGPMLADAKHYLWDDPDGPTSDPVGECRGQFIILITDGFPNSDLRPNCEDPGSAKSPPTQAWPSCPDKTKGCCPAKRPQDITYELANPPPGKRPVKTFVVGFAVSDDAGNPVDCKAINPASGICADPTLDAKYKPCCTLHEMAYNGRTSSTDPNGVALFANDTDELRAALVQAMSDATSKSSTSRTIPVFTRSANAASTSGQYEFRSSFKVNAFAPWSGVLERVRWECTKASGTLQAEPQSLDASKGDDFGANLNKQATRTFLTVDPTAVGGSAARSIRPNLNTADYDGVPVQTGVTIKDVNATFVSRVPAAALGITSTTCSDTANPDECKAKYLNYALALPQPKPTWQSRVGSALGDIYHATPVAVGAPSEFLRDESYTLFRNANQARTPMLLAATNDGILHAFRSDVESDSTGVELWGFVPPAVLPAIGKQYGGAHALLLDAAPVVKDVAFGPVATAGGGGGGGPMWGRTQANARAGLARWRTVAVGALTTGRGYYALDITEPSNPQFLWQLTKMVDASGKEYDLFGAVPGTPTIGTVFYKDDSYPEPVETPVAFLPGGEGVQHKSGTCRRWNKSGWTPSTTDPFTTPRDKVRCWVGAGNSFTVVRLWDGKILRTFRNNPLGDVSNPAEHPAEVESAARGFQLSGKEELVTGGKSFAGIDSPITGAVALYPAETGSVTTRAFVGDYDGTLWRLDVTPRDPRDWTFTPFHDAYFPADPANTDSTAWGPVAVAPVLTVDRFGDIVAIYATGDQQNFSKRNLNHVWSVTERLQTIGGEQKAVPITNWHLRFTDGNTPTGPLSLFSGELYFSTFTPDVASADACLSGQGTIWGVDYVEKEPSVMNIDGSPVPMGRHRRMTAGDDGLAAGVCPPSYPNADSRGTTHPFFRCINLEAPSIVFGAGITQRPSCVSASESAIGTDPYVGSVSSHQTVQGITPGAFQLVAQTGPKSPSGSSGGTQTNTYVRTLQPPLSSTRIDSWAAIVE